MTTKGGRSNTKGGRKYKLPPDLYLTGCVMALAQAFNGTDGFQIYFSDKSPVTRADIPTVVRWLQKVYGTKTPCIKK